MIVSLCYRLRRVFPRREFVRFCLVGAGGVVVDMVVLCALTGMARSELSLGVSKACAAEVALLNNFVWNELWTFRATSSASRSLANLGKRLVKFHLICGFGILVAIRVLKLAYVQMGLHLWLANLMAIAVATLWNFWLNACINWRIVRFVSPCSAPRDK